MELAAWTVIVFSVILVVASSAIWAVELFCEHILIPLLDAMNGVDDD